MEDKKFYIGLGGELIGPEMQTTLARWKKSDEELTDVPLEPSKLDAVIAYLRARGKYIIDNGCTFKPTPSTDRFSIAKRYAAKRR